jgi:hypothetical protein
LGHVFSKACQYGIAKEKVCKELKYVFVKFVQVYKIASLGLRNLKMGSRNGTRLVLRLAFVPKN